MDTHKAVRATNTSERLISEDKRDGKRARPFNSAGTHTAELQRAAKVTCFKKDSDERYSIDTGYAVGSLQKGRMCEYSAALCEGQRSP